VSCIKDPAPVIDPRDHRVALVKAEIILPNPRHLPDFTFIGCAPGRRAVARRDPERPSEPWRRARNLSGRGVGLHANLWPNGAKA
jgi:hypothetical protein